MQPLVSVSVIEVPVRVDQMFDWIVAQTRQRFSDPRLGARYPSIHENLAIGAGEDSNISAGTFEDADVAAQLRNSDLCGLSSIPNGDDGTFRFGEQTARH